MMSLDTISDDDGSSVAINANEETTSPVQKSTRLACNRCHSHKLRCPKRPNTTSEDCERCIRANAKCDYSVPLRLGRPRFLGRGSDSSSSKTIPAASEEGENMNPTSTNNASITSVYSTRSKRSRTSGPHDRRDPEVCASNSQNWPVPTKGKSSALNRKHQETEFEVADTGAPMPWRSTDDACNADTDMTINGWETFRPMDNELHKGLYDSSEFLQENFEIPRNLGVLPDFPSWSVLGMNSAPAVSDDFINAVPLVSPSLVPDNFDGILWPFPQDYLLSSNSSRSLETPRGSSNSPSDERSGENTYTLEECIQELSNLHITLHQCFMSSTTTQEKQRSRVVNVHMSAVTGTAFQASDIQADTIFQIAQTFIDILKQLAKHAPAADVKQQWLFPLPYAGSSSGQGSPSDPTSAEHFNATFFLLLTCYLQLLNICNLFVADLCVSLQSVNGISAHQAVRSLPSLRLGQFVPAASSELHILLLVQTVQHLLDRVDKGIVTCFPVAFTMNANQSNGEPGASSQQGQDDDQSRRIHKVTNQFTLREIKMRGEDLHAAVTRVTDLLKGSTLF
ncbi:hypothetical protein VTL71DRAFT_3634 [Oculimacula yallundae]|uniref:Zn(2)-C6 fungal-type domain-containing protein n=1 Tax=Oculimacula yallundae TaxID=86028 RepID=A0ABR4C7Q5_9HELO